MRAQLLGKTPDELKEIALKAGLPAFAGKQLAQWLYVRKVRGIDEMTNISKVGRERLKEEYSLGLTSLPPARSPLTGRRSTFFRWGRAMPSRR